MGARRVRGGSAPKSSKKIASYVPAKVRGRGRGRGRGRARGRGRVRVRDRVWVSGQCQG